MKEVLKRNLTPATKRRIKRILGLPKAAYVLAARPLAVDMPYANHVLDSLNGRFDRSCPICGYQGKFCAFGSPPRWDAECLGCGSVERHRLLYLAVTGAFPIPADADVLHFAPEACVQAFVRPLARTYLSADITGRNVDRALDVERLDLADGSFDVVICSHVLEHVDDRRALAELVRVLRPGGILYAMTPVIEGWDETYEVGGIDSEVDRELHFGQFDHVRFYGRDFRDRLTQSGFELSEYVAPGADCVTYGLIPGERIFVCRKPSTA